MCGNNLGLRYVPEIKCGILEPNKHLHKEWEYIFRELQKLPELHCILNVKENTDQMKLLKPKYKSYFGVQYNSVNSVALREAKS